LELTTGLVTRVRRGIRVCREGEDMAGTGGEEAAAEVLAKRLIEVISGRDLVVLSVGFI
jgi:hypothetical protein